MSRLARWIDTARAVRDARDSAAAHAQENVRLRHLLAERDRQLAELRHDLTLLEQHPGVLAANIKLAHNLEQAEALLAQEQAAHHATAAVLRGYETIFGPLPTTSSEVA